MGHPRHRGFETLIGLDRFFHEGVEVRILEDPPPVLAETGLRCVLIIGALVTVWHIKCRALIIRPGRAGRENQGERKSAAYHENLCPCSDAPHSTSVIPAFRAFVRRPAIHVSGFGNSQEVTTHGATPRSDPAGRPSGRGSSRIPRRLHPRTGIQPGQSVH